MIEGQGVNRAKGPATKVWLNEPIDLFIDDDSGSPVCLEPHHDSQLVGWRGTRCGDNLQEGSLPLHGIARRTDLRWALFGDSEKQFEIQALLCTDFSAEPERIISWFVSRWPMGATFQEIRQRLSFETQRHWSEMAILRTTPAMLGPYCVGVLFAHRMMADQPTEVVKRAAW